MYRILAECYANLCFAEKLKEFLGIEKIKFIHKKFYGRDHVIKKAERLSNNLIVIVDYEEGRYRVFIEKNFNLEYVCQNILVGIRRGVKKYIAIVFDPNMEEFVKSFRIKLEGKELKSKEAEKFFEKLSFFEMKDVKEILRKVAETALKYLREDVRKDDS
jgi:hypothetical protein